MAHRARPVGGGGNSPEVEEVAAVLSGEDALVDSVPPRMRGGQLRTQHGEWNGGDGWWRGAPVLDLLLAGVAGGGGQLLSMTGTVFWRAKETRPS